MQKNNIKEYFNLVPEYTPSVIKEASEFTKVNIRTLQYHYNGNDIVPSTLLLHKLSQFFSYKLGRNVTIDDLLTVRNSEHEFKSKASEILAKIRTPKRTTNKK